VNRDPLIGNFIATTFLRLEIRATRKRIHIAQFFILYQSALFSTIFCAGVVVERPQGGLGILFLDSFAEVFGRVSGVTHSVGRRWVKAIRRKQQSVARGLERVRTKLPGPQLIRFRLSLRGFQLTAGITGYIVEPNPHHTEVAEAAALQLEQFAPGRNLLLVHHSQKTIVSNRTLEVFGGRLIFSSTSGLVQISRWLAAKGHRLFLSTDTISTPRQRFELFGPRFRRKDLRGCAVVAHVKGRDADTWGEAEGLPTIIRLYEPVGEDSGARRFYPLKPDDFSAPLRRVDKSRVSLSIVGMTFLSLQALDDLNRLSEHMGSDLTIRIAGRAGDALRQQLQDFEFIDSSLVSEERVSDTQIANLLNSSHGILFPKPAELYRGEYSSSVQLSLEYELPLIAPETLLKQWGLPTRFGWGNNSMTATVRELIESRLLGDEARTVTSRELRRIREERVSRSSRWMKEFFGGA